MEPSRFRLAYRPPYAWNQALAFLEARATPGVEQVEGSSYRRTIRLGRLNGTIAVSRAPSGSHLRLDVTFPDPGALPVISERVRRVFDLAADPALVARHLGSDPLLRDTTRRHPGLRVPGAWDGFELAVRAILGQQVSVRAATTFAGRLAALFGTKVEIADGLDRLFPTAAQLTEAPLEVVGLIRSRAEAVRVLARHVAEGRIALDPSAEAATTLCGLRALPGIGEWTAQYIAMRALHERDAFPRGDLVLRRMAGGLTARELERRSQAWRPWRAYAVLLLWQKAKDEESGGRHDESNARRTGRIRGGRGPASSVRGRSA